jgi:hypothetical protein
MGLFRLGSRIQANQRSSAATAFRRLGDARVYATRHRNQSAQQCLSMAVPGPRSLARHLRQM